MGKLDKIPQDFNMEKPAEKHQKERKDDGREEDPGRRDALKLIGKGALYGIAAAVGFKGISGLASSKKENQPGDVLSSEQMIDLKFKRLSDDLDFIDEHSIEGDASGEYPAGLAEFKEKQNDYRERLEILETKNKKGQNTTLEYEEIIKIEAEISKMRFQLEKSLS